MGTAGVFRPGNSQAVRLPKQFRLKSLKSEEVEIFRRGMRSCVAAHALAAGLILVTNNEREFRGVRGAEGTELDSVSSSSRILVHPTSVPGSDDSGAQGEAAGGAEGKPNLASMTSEALSFSAAAGRRALRQRRRLPATNPALRSTCSPNRFSFQRSSQTV